SSIKSSLMLKELNCLSIRFCSANIVGFAPLSSPYFSTVSEMLTRLRVILPQSNCTLLVHI
ncbi:hypothetical protein, partial [Providencia sp. CRPN09747]